MSGRVPGTGTARAVSIWNEVTPPVTGVTSKISLPAGSKRIEIELAVNTICGSGMMLPKSASVNRSFVMSETPVMGMVKPEKTTSTHA